MAQPTVAAGGDGNPAEASPAQPFEDIANEMLGVDQEEEESPQEDGLEPTAEAEDEIEVEAEADDLPPIDAPVSWDAEAKDRFAKLPREDQEYLAKRESERERFVQQKSQEAARTKQDVEQAATQQLAQYQRSVAEQIQQMAATIMPQRPNPALIQHDPVTFYAQQAEYEGAVAQQQQLQQQAHALAEQANQHDQLAAQQEAQRERQIIADHFPEYLDPTSAPKLQQELTAVAMELGYPPELISQARATDIIAMRKVAELKAKADKFDKAMAKQMERVRAGKGQLPPVSKPGVAKGPDGSRRARADAAWETAKTAKSRPAKDEALAQWMENTGWL